MGGSELIHSFEAKGLIDEYIISIIPFLLGEGIRLFGESGTGKGLKMQSARSYASGLVQINYMS